MLGSHPTKSPFEKLFCQLYDFVLNFTFPHLQLQYMQCTSTQLGIEFAKKQKLCSLISLKHVYGYKSYSSVLICLYYVHV